MELNNIPSIGKFGSISNRINRNFDIVRIGISEMEYWVRKNKGMFVDSTSLTTAIPSPTVGDWALVGNEFPCAIYVCNTDGTWVDSGETYEGDVVELNDYVKATDADRRNQLIWETMSGLIYSIARKADSSDTEENGAFFTDGMGKVFLKYTNTEGLDAAKVSDHLKNLIIQDLVDNNPIRNVDEGGVFFTDSQGRVFMKYTNDEGLDIIKASNHLKGLIGQGSGGGSTVESPIRNIDEDCVSLITNTVGESAMVWSDTYGFNVNKVNYHTLKRIKNGYVKDMDAWEDLGCGMFIHWGVYSYLAGHFTGTDIHGNHVDSDVDYNAEWIFRFKEIPDATYKAYQSHFTTTAWDADLVARMAYNAGLKYIILTAKHHEGFTLYDSAYANWTIATSGARGEDPILELKKACEKYGLKFGLYFSQSRDWMAVGGFDQGWKNNNVDPYNQDQHNNYISMTIDVIKEMVNRYSPYVLWYDSPVAPDIYADRILDAETKDYPQVIVNWRLKQGYVVGDFATGENSYFEGDRTEWPYAENCYTINGSWGYWAAKDNAESTYSVALVLGRSFLESKCRNQNVLLNIGSKGNGEVSSITQGLFAEIGEYVQKYGTFDNTKSPNISSFPIWGRLLKKGRVLKAYVVGGVSTIRIDGINTKFLKTVRVYDASDEYSASNYTVVSDYTIEVTNIPSHSDHTPSVVDLEFGNDIVSEEYSNVLYNGYLTLGALAFNAKGAKVTNDSWNTWNFQIGAWTSSAHWIETMFLFNGTSGNYKISATLPSGNVSTVLTATLTNEEARTSSGVTFTRTSPISSATLPMTNGKVYKLKIVHDGTGWVNLTSITFVKQN